MSHCIFTTNIALKLKYAHNTTLVVLPTICLRVRHSSRFGSNEHNTSILVLPSYLKRFDNSNIDYDANSETVEITFLGYDIVLYFHFAYEICHQTVI